MRHFQSNKLQGDFSRFHPADAFPAIIRKALLPFLQATLAAKPQVSA
jgi:hypothetical protein